MIFQNHSLELRLNPVRYLKCKFQQLFPFFTWGDPLEWKYKFRFPLSLLNKQATGRRPPEVPSAHCDFCILKYVRPFPLCLRRAKSFASVSAVIFCFMVSNKLLLVSVRKRLRRKVWGIRSKEARTFFLSSFSNLLNFLCICSNKLSTDRST